MPNGVREQKMQALVEFCRTARSSMEMMEHVGLSSMHSFRKNYLIPMQEAGLIRKTIPDTPTRRDQKYIANETAPAKDGTQEASE